MSLESATFAVQLSSADPQSSDPRSQGDDHLRMVKAVIRQELNAANKGWTYTGDTITRVSATAFTVAGNQTDTYSEGRRARVVGSATGTIYGRISSSTYSANTAVNLAFDSGSMSNETLYPYVGPRWDAIGGTTGTYTPALAFGGSSTGITYSVLNGSYFRIGNMVSFYATLILTSKGAQVGTATVSLPLTNAATEASAQMIDVGNITLAVGRPWGYITPGSTCTLYDATTALTNTEFANNSLLNLSGVYYAA